MPEDSSVRPFLWSEIHEIAKERTAQLDAAIRKEIGNPKVKVPEGGAGRRQFFLLLEEKANSWGDRARDACEDCLKKIGRADSHSARRSVFQNALSFFLSDNLCAFLYLECGCYVERPHTVRRPGQPRTYTSLVVRHDVRQLVSAICDRVKSRIEREFTRSGGNWLAHTHRLLREIQPQLPNPIARALYGPQPVASTEEAMRLPASPEAKPTSTPADRPPPQSGSQNLSMERREALVKRIMAAPSGMTFSYQDAADALGMSTRGIRNWIDEGKLEKGKKRSTVKADSLKQTLA